MSRRISYIFRKSRPKFFSIEGVFSSIIDGVSKTNEVKRIELSRSGGRIKDIVFNIIKLKRSKEDLYHITGDVQYMAFATGRNTVLTIHDVNSIIKGNFFKKIYMSLFWFWLPALVVKRITVISKFTQKELEKVIPFAKEKIRVVYNPVKSTFQYNYKDFNSKEPKVLLLGTKKNKNLKRTLRALKDIKCQVTIIGVLGEEYKKLLSNLRINYVNKFNLTEDQILNAYHETDLVCFASTYEGFGMPIIEAQAVGRPVITSDLGAMREVADQSACLVNPYDVISIKEGVVKVIEDSDYREKLIEKGLKNVERFRNDSIVKSYLDIYDEIIYG